MVLPQSERSGRPLPRSIYRKRGRSGSFTGPRCGLIYGKMVLEGAVAYRSPYPVQTVYVLVSHAMMNV